MKKRIAVLLLAVLLAATSSTSAIASPAVQPTAAAVFADLPEEHWSHRYVADLSAQGVVKGYPDGTFRPANTVTWGEAFKLILLAVGVEEPEHIEGEHWALPYVQPALDNRLLFSFDEAYLDGVPTRREVARMAARALDLTDISGESPYADCDDGYVTELYEKGIMDGFLDETGVRTFQPDKSISREEMSAIIWRLMNVDVTEGMFRFSNYWLDELEGVPAIPFTRDQFGREEESGRVTYSGGYVARGIDVSGHKQEIDWPAVTEDGIEFAIIRAGNRLYGKDSTAAVCEDTWFDRNMEGAIAAGLDVGAYFFSAAITVEEAIEEADFLLARLEPYREHITYPVVCDWEYLGGSKSRAHGVDAKIITQCIAAFCQRVEEAGYQPMFYFNDYCGYIKMDLSKLTQYPFWYAEYASVPNFRYGFQMWQYSSKGKVAGIKSDVDMDLCFVPYGKGTPVDPNPTVTDPLETEPVETAPVETDPVETGPLPGETEPT